MWIGRLSCRICVALGGRRPWYCVGASGGISTFLVRIKESGMLE